MAKFEDISPPIANLVGDLCGTLFYGIQTVVYSACIYILLRKRCWGMNGTTFLIGLATLEFIVSTIHIGNGWRNLIVAFIWDANIPSAYISYWGSNPANPAHVIANTLPIVNSILADVTLIWRLYVVWGNNWTICVFPCISVVAYSITCFIGAAKLVALVDSGSFFTIAQYYIAGLIVSAFTHTTVTCLIAGKIWWAVRRSPVIYHRAAYMSVFWTVIDSGALYSAAAIIFATMCALKTQAGGLFQSIFVQLSAIISTLVVVRARLRLVYDTKHVASTAISVPIEFRNQETVTSSGAAALRLPYPDASGAHEKDGADVESQI